jgi:hypothetical protein
MAVPPEDASKSGDPQRPKVRRTFEPVNRIGTGQAKTPGASESEQNLVEAAPNLGGESAKRSHRLGRECDQRHLVLVEPQSPAQRRIGHGRPFELFHGPVEE